MRRIRAAAVVMAALSVGCYEPSFGGPIICTDQFVYGLTVEVLDATTSAAIADGATLTVVEGSYVETVTETWDGRSMAAAGERPGTYTVSVTRDGYQAWSRSGVSISADECHVIPRALEARLEPTQP